MTTRKHRTTVQSLQRGLEILAAVAQAERPLGITELSQEFGLAKGSISRLVTTLVDQSFLVRVPETGKYRSSMKLWELGNGVVSRVGIRDITHPVLEALNEATQETVHLAALTESDEIVLLDKLDSTRAVRPHVVVGVHLPPHCVANGKVMLAFLPRSRVEQVLHGKLRAYTDTTIVGKRKLLAQFAEIRRQGYAVNRGEYRSDVWGLAAPIRDHTGAAVAALGISVPSQRLSEELIAGLAPRLVRSAEEISQALGHRGDRVVSEKAIGESSPSHATGRGRGEAHTTRHNRELL